MSRMTAAFRCFIAWMTITTTTIMNFVQSNDGMMSSSSSLTKPLNKALLLDVDNTVYLERHASIEAQIVQNTHHYCHHVLNVSHSEADKLYRNFGSTIEGLRQTTWKGLTPNELHEKMKDFYQIVYDGIDPSRIVGLGMKRGNSRDGSTGYFHGKDTRLTRQLLKHCPIDILVASNSPSWHVQKVFSSLGLAQLMRTTQIYTPDRIASGFPTKQNPIDFFRGEDHSDANMQTTVFAPYDSISFVDDSQYNLDIVQKAFPDRIHTLHQVNADTKRHHLGDGNDSTLAELLLQELGLVSPAFEFDQIRYLKSKNLVDRESIHVATWNRVVNDLTQTLRQLEGGQVWIVDLGAGLLSMLDLLLHGYDRRGLQGLPISTNEGGVSVQYTVYESNPALYAACYTRLRLWGFEILADDDGSHVAKRFRHRTKSIQVQILLRNFSDETEPVSGLDDTIAPHLIMGCCFADLMDPNVLIADLITRFGLLHRSSASCKRTLIYFPITFSGTTQFLPPQPFQSAAFRLDGKLIPSDTVAFRCYSQALESVLGHNLDPYRLIDAMENHGAMLLTVGSSNWKIDPNQDKYLYETLLYFFGSTGGPELLEQGYDASGWISRARQNCPSIQVTNKDLLFQITPPSSHSKQIQKKHTQIMELKEILFTEPRKVIAVKKDIPTKLGPKQVLIQSSHSLISSGTELKIFNGNFDDAPLDVSIQNMAEERMAYPLSYGYCLVGFIVDCGVDVPREKYMNQLVFTFSPHATHVVTDMDAIQLVPDGISPQDAIFMPSVETALSLVHDAHVRLGEQVAVYGQGLIGLLVTALLSSCKDPNPKGMYSTVSVFDMRPDRLAAASAMGASQALLPGGYPGPFDVSIEVSGNARALQSAIDHTRDGGKVIVGSWYGNAEVSLKLGIDFHRSHKTIQASQVSEISANLCKLWSKQRRFGLAWELVQQIRPYRLLTKTVSIDEAQEAYNALDNMTEIAVAFDYSSGRE